MFDITKLKPKTKNPRKITAAQLDKLKQSITEFEKMLSLRPIVYDPDTGEVLGGNQRLRALLELGYKEVPDDWVRSAEGMTEEEKRRFVLTDNAMFGEWDFDILSEEYAKQELLDWGLEDILPEMFNEPLPDVDNKQRQGNLLTRFIVPPFSVLDTRLGYWQDRKRMWLSLGLKSEVGRKEGLTYSKSSQPPRFYEIKNQLVAAGKDSSTDAVIKEAKRQGVKLLGGENGSTSIFDPVLCEICYQWFNVPNGKILDPFAGGSVRGIVAAKLGYPYWGNDLSAEQIDANYCNAEEMLPHDVYFPVWTVGDSSNIDQIAAGYEADFLFSCPPYGDLEVYSDEKEDISNMPYEGFLSAYREIIRKSCEFLKQDRFACFVVGDLRDKQDGFMRNFVSHTIQAFEDSGVLLYNEIILFNTAGSLPTRITKQFNSGRKIGKTHQNVLVFFKGNPKKIKDIFPELEGLDEIMEDADG